MKQTFIVRHNDDIQMVTTKTKWTHVTIYRNLDGRELIGSWHRSEKAAAKGTSDAKTLGWVIVKVVEIAPETDVEVIAQAEIDKDASIDRREAEEDAKIEAAEEAPGHVEVVYPEHSGRAFMFCNGESGNLVRSCGEWFAENEYGENIWAGVDKTEAIRRFAESSGVSRPIDVTEKREYEMFGNW